MRAESLPNVVVVTKTGSVSTTAACHVSNSAVLAVLRAKAVARSLAESNKVKAAAAAAQKKEERVAAAAERAAAADRARCMREQAEESLLLELAATRNAARRQAGPLRVRVEIAKERARGRSL